MTTSGFKSKPKHMTSLLFVLGCISVHQVASYGFPYAHFFNSRPQDGSDQHADFFDPLANNIVLRQESPQYGSAGSLQARSGHAISSLPIIYEEGDDRSGVDIAPKRYIDYIANELIDKESVDRNIGGNIESNIELSLPEDLSLYDSEEEELIAPLFENMPVRLPLKDVSEIKNKEIETARINQFTKFNDSFQDTLEQELAKESQKRLLDPIASHIIKREDLNSVASQESNKLSEESDKDKRYLDNIGSSLIKRKQQNGGALHSQTDENKESAKRHLDHIGSSLIKKEAEVHRQDLNSLKNRMHDGYETTDEGMRNEFKKHNKQYGLSSMADANVQGLDHKLEDELSQLKGVKLPINGSPNKRYLDGIASSLIKKQSSSNEKRYLDGIASSLIKKESSSNEKRYLDGIASSLIKKESSSNEKRYLDGIASSLIKKESSSNEKRYLDGIASSLIKKDSGEKRYLDGIASSLIKKDTGEKRYLDGIASSLIKKESGPNEKRYLDGIASSLIKKDTGEKRYLDGIASSLIKKDTGEKRYLDGIASSLIKKDTGEKRYLDGIASSLIKKDTGQKRYLDGIASSLIKKDTGEKRYLDGIASSLIKKDTGEKRYLDGIASSLIKKDTGSGLGRSPSSYSFNGATKRYLDGIASSLIKKDVGGNEKRYLDGIASSLIKKEDSGNAKRYLDGIASSLIKKESSGVNEKRYLDGIASSLIKKESNQNDKRYLDGIASSLIKKESGDEEKRYLDGIASSLIKKEHVENDKRYLDGIASSLIKKESGDAEKRYLDGIASSLIKKEHVEYDKRYLDGIASHLIKKESGDAEKRYLDGIASSLIKKDSEENKRYLDGIASSLIKKNDGTAEKRYLDGIASSLIKKDKDSTEKRYLDGIANSLIKKSDESPDKRYLDGIASSLIKKEQYGFQNKRYLDGIASSLIKKSDETLDKRYLDGIASSLIKKSDGSPDKRYLDGIASSLIKRDQDSLSDSGTQKSASEVTDTLTAGTKDVISSEEVKSQEQDKELETSGQTRKRRDVSLLPFQDVSKTTTNSKQSRQKRFIDSIASTLLYRRSGQENSHHDLALSTLDSDNDDDDDDGSSSNNQRYSSFRHPYYHDDPDHVPYLSSEGEFDQLGYETPGSHLPKSEWTFDDVEPTQGYFQTTEIPMTGSTPSVDIDESRGDQQNEAMLQVEDIAHRILQAQGDTSVPKEVRDAYIDELASKLFSTRHVMKKRYLDDVASTLLHKRYLDTLASNLIKRYDGDVEEDSTEETRFNSPEKRFSVIPNRDYSRERTDVADESMKRYIDTLASSLLYKRRGEERSSIPSFRYRSYSRRGYTPSTFMRSRLRAFHPISGPRGKKLEQASSTWRGRPTLMTAMLATGKGPQDEETMEYLRSAMTDYVTDVTRNVLSNAKIMDKSIENRMSQQKIVSQRQARRHNNFMDNTIQRDYFDQLAGSIL